MPTPQDQICYVRLKPYNPAKGHVKQRHRMGAQCGWKDVMFLAGQLQELSPHACGKWLESVRQEEFNPGSPLAFDVWYSKEECNRALHLENMANLGRARNPLVDSDAGKPPELEDVKISELDEPVATSQMQAEAMAAQIIADKSTEAEASDDLADLVSAALDTAPAVVDPADSRPPHTEPVTRKSPKKATRKAPKRKTRR